MPNLSNARDGAVDVCKCGGALYLVSPANRRGLNGWHWVHSDTHSMWCPKLQTEAEPVNHKLDEDADQSMSISNYRLSRTPLSQLGYSQRCRYYMMDGAGPLNEITEGEYEFILRKAIVPDERDRMMHPFCGVVFKGRGYLVLPTEG